MAESVFTTQTPVSTDLTDGTDYTLATLVIPAVAGNVLGIRWWFPTVSPSSAPVGALYLRTSDASGILLGQATFSAGWTPGAWNSVFFASPVAVTAGQTYYACVWTPNRYVASGGFFTGMSVVHGNLTSPADDTVTPARNGRFTASAGTLSYPTGQFSGGCYFPDILFAQDVTISGTPSGILPVSAGSLDVTGTPGVNLTSTTTAPRPRSSGFLEPEQTGTGTGWYGMISIIQENAERYTDEMTAAPVDCPQCSWPLEIGTTGILHCKFDGWTDHG